MATHERCRPQFRSILHLKKLAGINAEKSDAIGVRGMEGRIFQPFREFNSAIGR
jgi:hypothetical protein